MITYHEEMFNYGFEYCIAIQWICKDKSILSFAISDMAESQGKKPGQTEINGYKDRLRSKLFRTLGAA